MDLTQLTRPSKTPTRPGPRLLGRFDLRAARAHEFCGPARRRLALWLARESQGDIVWIRPDWHHDRLHMAGIAPEIDPARLLIVEVARLSEMLWSTEEALRSGAVSLVVTDLPEPPGLTPVRRLHLAAEAGAAATAAAGAAAPIALLLCPGDGGAAGVETRWHLQADYTPATLSAPAPRPYPETANPPDPSPHRPPLLAERWRLARRRARTAPPSEWHVTRDSNGNPVPNPLPAPEPTEPPRL